MHVYLCVLCADLMMCMQLAACAIFIWYKGCCVLLTKMITVGFSDLSSVFQQFQTSLESSYVSVFISDCLFDLLQVLVGPLPTSRLTSALV